MIITEIPETTSYFWKQSRSATYSSWPFNDSDKCNAERMAAAGFYVVGNNESDMVKCFICGNQFGNWKSDDDPWSKHMKYLSLCPFVKINKQDENKWTLKDLIYLCCSYGVKIDMDELKKTFTRLKDDRERLSRNQFLNRILSKNKKNKKRLKLGDEHHISQRLVDINLNG